MPVLLGVVFSFFVGGVSCGVAFFFADSACFWSSCASVGLSLRRRCVVLVAGSRCLRLVVFLLPSACCSFALASSCGSSLVAVVLCAVAFGCWSFRCSAFLLALGRCGSVCRLCVSSGLSWSAFSVAFASSSSFAGFALSPALPPSALSGLFFFRLITTRPAAAGAVLRGGAINEQGASLRGPRARVQN